MPQALSPRQFAECIGVSESSVRRWADGGRIQMTRTAGGHRKIARAEALRFIRETGSSIVRPDLLAFEEPSQRRGRPEAFADRSDELYEALREGRESLAFGLITSMHLNGLSAAQICDGPLRAAMTRIGSLWPDDKRAIFIEHRATAICSDALSRLRNNFATPKSHAPIAVGGAAGSDPYTLPSLMVATTLAELGFETVNLGANTPLEVLSQSAVDLKASLAWASLTAALPKKPTERALVAARRRLSRARIPLVVGGASTTRYELPPHRHLHALGSLTELSGFAKNLLAQRSAES